MAGQRLVELLVGELAGGPVRHRQQRLLVVVRLAGQHVVGPARDGETAQEHFSGGLH
jgi:hypothetical protein